MKKARIYEFDAVIFDMDGVLIDSRSVIEEAWCFVAKKHGKFLSKQERNHHIHGRTGIQTVAYLFGDLPKIEQKNLWNCVDQIEETANYQEIKGACYFVNSLYNAGVKIGLVTSSWRTKIDNALSGLGILEKFHKQVTRDDVIHGKPAPDPYLKCAQLLEIDPKNILVFEDAISGVTSATKAGATCIGIGESELLEAGATALISDFSELKIKVIKEGTAVIFDLPNQCQITIFAKAKKFKN
ncbi:MAG: HAD family hydrolase [Tenacibaculum sp.]